LATENRKVIWSLLGNYLFGWLLDKIIGTTLYGEKARESISGVTGYLWYEERNMRANYFARLINWLMNDPYHCLDACKLYKIQTKR